MKKLSIIVIVCIAVLMLCQSCKKDADVYITNVVTESVSSYYDGVVKVDCSISAQRTPSIDVRGVCYSNHNNPTMDDNCSNDSLKCVGQYTCTISNFNPKTTYYVRAYAKNEYGIIYGEEKTFNTPNFPKLSIVTVTDITNISAVGTAQIEYDNKLINVSEQGFCYCTGKTPTILAEKVVDLKKEKNMRLSISNINRGTTYNIKAYAICDVGIIYGVQNSFTTDIEIPTVETTSVSNITPSSVLFNGFVTDDGGTAATERGFCYSLLKNPTINDEMVSSGSGFGAFSCLNNRLKQNTKYYVRAFARNSKGIVYGEQLEFIVPDISEVTDICGNTYHVVMIDTQYWITENFRCNKYDTQSEAYKAYWLKDNTIPTSEIDTYTPYYTDASDITKWSSIEYSSNLSNAQIAKLGYLYNWAAVVGVADGEKQVTVFTGNRQGICPNGWHVPTSTEWQELKYYVIADEAGKHLKTISGWYCDGNGDDTYGFSVLPAGFSLGDDINDVGRYSSFWTTTLSDYSANLACGINLYYDYIGLTIGNSTKKFCGNVRCVRN